MLEVSRQIGEFGPVRAVRLAGRAVGSFFEDYHRMAHEVSLESDSCQHEVELRRRSALERAQEILEREQKACAPHLVRDLLVRGEV